MGHRPHNGWNNTRSYKRRRATPGKVTTRWEGEELHMRKGHLRREKQNEGRLTQGERGLMRVPGKGRDHIVQGHVREEGHIIRAGVM